jgi:uncharacterized RDD family membrane protein YckC
MHALARNRSSDDLETNEPIDTVVAIEAPEQIRFRYRLAGPAQRGIAHLVDLLVIVALLAVTVLLTMLLSAPFASWVQQPGALERAGKGLFLLGLFLAQWGYFALFEAFAHGQTPGKRLLSLRVLEIGGEPITFVDAVLRNLLRAADLLPFGYAAGLTSMLLDSRFRRLGDLAAGTIVVVEDRARVAVPIYIHPPTPEEAQHLPARVVLDADELRAIEMFLRRAPTLGGPLATALATSVAEAIGKRHGASHRDPVRLLALLYLRATAPSGSRSRTPSIHPPAGGSA